MKSLSSVTSTSAAAAATTAPLPRRIVLAGNPNAGKSVIFHALSGVYADVSNYPGTTIEIAQASLGGDRLQDSPGVYGLGSFNDEERVARDVILNADVLINVVDAVHLQRDLFLTLQLLELGKPMVVALNMMDEAAGREVHIDVAQLQHRLGVPVVPMTAVKREGVPELRKAIDQSRPGFVDPHWHVVLDELTEAIGSRGEALLMLEGDAEILARHADLDIEPMREEMYQTRRRRADALVDGCVGQFRYRRQLRDRISWLTLHPLSGGLLVIGVLWLMYEVIGVLLAGRVVAFTEGSIMQAHYEPAVQALATHLVTPASFSMIAHPRLAHEIDALANSGVKDEVAAAEEVQRIWAQQFENRPWSERRNWSGHSAFDSLSAGARNALESSGLLMRLQNDRYYYCTPAFPADTWEGKVATIFAGPYGLLTHTVRYLVGLLIPLVVGFYLMLALLEDCGYLPRLATLADRALNTIGLNGRAVIPIILGFGCVTMATITTRLLGTEREKSIATSILNFVVPCSAQLGVIVGILALAVAGMHGSIGPIILYCSVILGVLILLGTLLDRLLPGKSSQLFIELPPLRLPRVDNVAKKTFIRSLAFVKEAFPWFVLGSFVVAVMQVFGLLDLVRDALAPLTESWLRLTRDSADAFIMGMVRRDFGAAGLTRLAKSGTLNPWQMTVSLIVITLFVPCIASLLILLKERGWKQAMSIWIGTWVAAFAIGGAVAQGLRIAGMLR